MPRSRKSRPRSMRPGTVGGAEPAQHPHRARGHGRRVERPLSPVLRHGRRLQRPDESVRVRERRGRGAGHARPWSCPHQPDDGGRARRQESGGRGRCGRENPADQLQGPLDGRHQLCRDPPRDSPRRGPGGRRHQREPRGELELLRARIGDDQPGRPVRRTARERRRRPGGEPGIPESESGAGRRPLRGIGDLPGLRRRFRLQPARRVALEPPRRRGRRSFRQPDLGVELGPDPRRCGGAFELGGCHVLRGRVRLGRHRRDRRPDSRMERRRAGRPHEADRRPASASGGDLVDHRRQHQRGQCGRGAPSADRGRRRRVGRRGATPASGSWTSYAGLGYEGDHAAAVGVGADGPATATATWTFSGLAPGRYRVLATWVPADNRATDAPFTVGAGGARRRRSGSTRRTRRRRGRWTSTRRAGRGGRWAGRARPSSWRARSSSSGSATTPTRASTSSPTASASSVWTTRWSSTTPAGRRGATPASGSWTSYAGLGYGGDHAAAVGVGPAGPATATATWTFSGLAPGRYRVLATWVPADNRATDAPFTVVAGGARGDGPGRPDGPGVGAAGGRVRVGAAVVGAGRPGPGLRGGGHAARRPARQRRRRGSIRRRGRASASSGSVRSESWPAPPVGYGFNRPWGLPPRCRPDSSWRRRPR